MIGNVIWGFVLAIIPAYIFAAWGSQTFDDCPSVLCGALVLANLLGYAQGRLREPAHK